MTTESNTPADGAPPAGTPAASDGATPNATGGQPAADGAKPAGDGTTLATAAPADGVKPPADGADNGEKNADGTPKTKAAEPVVPEAYTFEMPEGMQLDKAAADEFSAIAKEFKLTQDQATKFTGIAVAMQQRQMEAHANQVASWAETVKGDKDIGGDKLPATLANTRKVMDTFGTPELKAALDSSGYGNHPEFIRFVAKIGSQISSDTFVKGGNTTTAPVASAQRAFPNSNMNP